MLADDQGLWHFTDRQEFADFTVYFESESSNADFRPESNVNCDSRMFLLGLLGSSSTGSLSIESQAPKGKSTTRSNKLAENRDVDFIGL